MLNHPLILLAIVQSTLCDYDQASEDKVPDEAQIFRPAPKPHQSLV